VRRGFLDIYPDLQSEAATAKLWTLRSHALAPRDDRRRERGPEAGLEEVQPSTNQNLPAHSVDPYFVSILRYGNREQVVVVAEKSGEVMYWEDVEEGFNISPVGSDGQILQHWCNQDDLGVALNEWIEGRRKNQNLSPAKPLNS